MSAVGTVALLASELPDPGAPLIVGLLGAAGTVLGATISRLRRLPPERVAHMTGTGTWIGLSLGFATWFSVPAIDRL